MILAEAQDIQISEHPIDAMEKLAAAYEWPSERGTEDDMNICVSGKYCDLHIAISWRSDLGVSITSFQSPCRIAKPPEALW